MHPPSAPGDPAPGARIGRFLIVEQLGQGGMGVVYRAMEENLGREVALKVISPHLAHDADFRERFTREARAQASLESAHVVAVYAHGEEDGNLYIASQLIPGGDLGQLIRGSGTLPVAQALEIIEQVASGLADAHDAGLVHRDIKPGNVLVRRRPGALRAYLADFGIARRINAAATRLTSSTAGTPSYMAPELHGGAVAGPTTDIYALGCVLWVALTGRPPYQGVSEYQLVAAHVREPVPQLPGTSPMVNAANRILRTAMAKEAAERYQSAAEMRADLQAALRLPATAAAVEPAATALRPRPTGPGTRPPVPWSPTPGGINPASPTPAATPSPTPAPTSPGFLSGATPAGRRTSRKWWWMAGAAALTALGVGIAAAVVTAEDQPDDPEQPATTAEEDFLAMDPQDILRASEGAMAVVRTARIRGQFEDGQDRLIVDVVATTRGDCKGTMTSGESGGVAELLRVSDDVYIRADAAYWTAAGASEATHDILRDRWVMENSLRESTEAFCDLDEFLERDGREDADTTSLGEAEVGGERTVKIEQTEGDQREVVFVRTAEPHYVMRIEESALDTFEFSAFDVPVEITAPPEDEIFDLDDYQPSG
ncbi:serine/threonine-protein kinase [Nocardioides caeni]|uniref:non-specific serine/threonine protein kinase n=1 Tax=Nocardioides caeni TaxID=574700 RepID=A0A4S8N4Y5_9ACTN|nr:serine/threonine-protein kinase [Nocardioides caeni]THV11180.1 serine/threonine protein kinase [Nocardioides caeni]